MALPEPFQLSQLKATEANKQYLSMFLCSLSNGWNPLYQLQIDMGRKSNLGASPAFIDERNTLNAL